MFTSILRRTGYSARPIRWNSTAAAPPPDEKEQRIVAKLTETFAPTELRVMDTSG